MHLLTAAIKKIKTATAKEQALLQARS